MTFTIVRDVILHWILTKIFPYRDIWKPAIPGMLARYQLDCPHTETTDLHEREGLSMLGRCNGCGCVMVLYLRRYFLDRKDTWVSDSRPFLHNIRKSDDDRDPHDHPWDFTTVLLSSGYNERVWQHHGRYMVEDRFWRPRFSILQNSARHIHKVLVPKNRTVWSFVRVRSAHRKWGFWVRQPDSTYRWMYYRDYLSIHTGPELDPDDTDGAPNQRNQ